MIPSLPSGLPSIRNAKLPEVYQSARAALEKCSRVDECQEWADKAAALASYAKQADDDALHQMATRIRARAIRQCGLLLKEIQKKAGRPKANSGGAPTITRSQAAKDAGLSRDQKVAALRVASVEPERFDSAVESARPPTVSTLADMGKRPAPKPLVDLEGRDPEEFKVATQVQGEMRRFLEVCSEVKATVIVRASFPKERIVLMKQARAIAAWTERLIKALEDA